MSEPLPSINVVIITFLRRQLFARTVESLFTFLGYSGDISWVIADDCTPEPDYHNFIRSLNWDWRPMRIESPPVNGGWGVNANNALAKCEHDITFFIEDDYVLTHYIDLTPSVAILLENEAVGLFRMDGIAGHLGISCMTAETDVSRYLPDYRAGISLPGKVPYWLIDQRSNHLNVYSNRPHLKHRRFHEKYKKYPEGYQLGRTESMMAHMVKDRMRADPNDSPAIAVPFDATSYFDHVGVSFQLSEYDKERK